MAEREEDSIAKWRRITRQKSLDYRIAEIAKIPPALHQAYLEALEYLSDLDYDRASFQVMSGEERIFLYALRCHIIYGPFKETGAWVLSAIDRAKRDAWRKVSQRLAGQSTLEAVELFVATVEDVIGRFPLTPTATKTLKKLQLRKRRPIVIHGFDKDHLTNAFIFICLLRNLPFEIVLQPLPKEDSLESDSLPWIDDNAIVIRGRFVVLKHLSLLSDPGAEGTVPLFPSAGAEDSKEDELALRIDMYLEWHLLHCYPLDQFLRDDNHIRTIEEHWLRFPSLPSTPEPFIGGAVSPTVADVLCFMKLSLMAGDQLPGLNFFSPKIQRYLQIVEKRFEPQLVEFRKVSHFPVTLKASL